MSATNRGGLARHANDFYETPSAPIDLVLDALDIGHNFRGYVLDPGSGTGHIAHRVALRAPNADIRGVELDPMLVDIARSTRAQTIAFECHDWLTWQADGTPDLIIGNPPYGPVSDRNLAEKFIRKALAVAGKKGRVAMLLRANFLIPKTRRALREDFGLPDFLALEKRPSFNGSGTDATDYAWHVWGPKSSGKWSVLHAATQAK
jgi:methylase of polypeptide subunit release factors